MRLRQRQVTESRNRGSKAAKENDVCYREIEFPLEPSTTQPYSTTKHVFYMLHPSVLNASNVNLGGVLAAALAPPTLSLLRISTPAAPENGGQEALELVQLLW